MFDDIYYYVGFSHFLGIGPTRFTALMNHFGSVKKSYEGDRAKIKEIIGSNWGEKFIEFRKKFDPVKKLEELKRKHISVIPLSSKFYPKKIKEISDPPICLYVKGKIESFPFDTNVCLAIVGTRRPTSYGQQMAKKFSEELTEAGCIIVSGLAIGIDAVAHLACINSGGRTIAVLGCGVDIIYPAINSSLYYKIIEKDGLIISEFPPGQTVVKGLFIARNRIISALSLGVLVIEGARDSGAMITARYAAEQGKEVFALPGPLTSKMSEAPHNLLKQGAKLVTSTDDIFEEFNLRRVQKKSEDIESKLELEEKIIYTLLKDEPKSSDELTQETTFPIEKILNLLSILEIKGVVEKNSEGKYQLS